jgi:formylglycine-generating enzyme required for sulfatase activity
LTQPYNIGEYEVTAAQFLKFANATNQPVEKPENAHVFWRNFLVEGQNDKLPVVGVTWNEAQAFCLWLSQQDQLKYDLPTEAQWEFACRAGTQTLWSSGDDVTQLDKQAIFGQKTPLTPIGLKSPNPFGLYDIHGNATEWCLDWHQNIFYSRSPLVDPVCLDQPNDPGSGRVARGGSWNSAAWWNRSATRDYDNPSRPAFAKGFRVVIRGDLKPAAAIKPPEENPAPETTDIKAATSAP